VERDGHILQRLAPSGSYKEGCGSYSAGREKTSCAPEGALLDLNCS